MRNLEVFVKEFFIKYIQSMYNLNSNEKVLLKNLLDELNEFNKNGKKYSFGEEFLQLLISYSKMNSFKQLMKLLKIVKRTIISEFVNKDIVQSNPKYIIDCNNFFDKLEEKCYDNYCDNLYGLESVRKVVDKVNMLFFVFEGKKLKYINPIVEEYLGYSLEELKNIKMYSICCKEHVYDLKNALKDKTTSKPVNIEIKVKDKKGRHKWVHVRTLNVNVLGKERKLLIATDITQRKLMDIEVKNNEEKYKNILELMPDPVIICVKGRIFYANKAALNLLNKKELKDVEGKTCFDYLAINKKIKNELCCNINDLEKTVQLNTMIVRTKRVEDKKVFYLETKLGNMNYQGKKAVLITLRDVTEKRKMEKLEKKIMEKMLLLKQARELDKIKSEIFGNISHEIRTPLNIIFSVNQLMSKLVDEQPETKLNDTKLKEYISMSRQNSYRILRLVNNIIDLSRVELGYMPMQLKRYNVVEVIEEITISVANFLKDRNIDVIFDTNVEEKIVYFDLEKIKRVMLNLLSNSIKFSSAGGEILVTLKAQKKKVAISVKDNGVGIPKDKQEEIFKAFTRVDGSFTRMAEGTGVGLSVVNAFIKLHGGDVYVNSEYGVGSEFVIEIPCNEYNLEDEKTIHNFNFAEEKNMINIEFSDIYA